MTVPSLVLRVGFLVAPPLVGLIAEHVGMRWTVVPMLVGGVLIAALAGPLLDRLHKLVRADSTTRNKRRARRLQESYDSLEQRISELKEAEDLQRVRPDLDGNAIMELLGLQPGPEVGAAWKFLKELRLDRGPLDRDEAEAELTKWWAGRQGS